MTGTSIHRLGVRAAAAAVVLLLLAAGYLRDEGRLEAVAWTVGIDPIPVLESGRRSAPIRLTLCLTLTPDAAATALVNDRWQCHFVRGRAVVEVQPGDRLSVVPGDSPVNEVLIAGVSSGYTAVVPGDRFPIRGRSVTLLSGLP